MLSNFGTRRGACAAWVTWLEGACVAGASWATYSLFHNPMCGLIFACGCTWSFRGGWSRCNVHWVGMRSPRCPWCVSPRDTPNWTWTTGEACTIAVMVASWLLATFATTNRSQEYDENGEYDAVTSEISPISCVQEETKPWPSVFALSHVQRRFSKRAMCCRWVVPLLAFLVHHSIVGLAFALGTGYPYYYFFTLPNTQPSSLPLPPFINATVP